MEIGWEDLCMRRMATRWKSAKEKLKPRTKKFMNLMIEWGRAGWTARNGMIYGERHQHCTLERKNISRGTSLFISQKKRHWFQLRILEQQGRMWGTYQM